jgi:TPR repeat protein
LLRHAGHLDFSRPHRHLSHPASPSEAVELSTKYANMGDANAQKRLGKMYQDGYGELSQDSVQADKWFMLAAAQRDNDAAELHLKVEKSMTQEQIAEAKKLASEWRPTALRPGSFAGQFAEPAGAPAIP